MIPQIPELDPKIVAECIKKVKSLDINVLSIEEIFEELKPLFNGYQITTSNLHPGIDNIKIYRISVPHQAQNIADLSHPPPEITPIGRVNRAGKPMFYGSSDLGAAIIERRPKRGDMFSLSQWTTTEKLLYNHVGFSDPILRKRGSMRPVEHLEEVKPIGEASQIVNEFLADVFTETIDENAKHKYKLTIAIAEQLLLPIANNELSFAGLRYPSVAMYARADNLALFPDYVRTSLKLTKAEFVQIVDVRTDSDNNTTYEWIVLNTASAFSEDGTIEWENS